jgi:uncharacterized membrane protein YeiH
MTVNPTPALLDSLYWITLIAVIVSSASGVLKAGFKQFDLFGVIIIVIATGLATFGVAGTRVAVMVGAPWLVAGFMGVMAGAAIFITRLLTIKFNISLPRFRFES